MLILVPTAAEAHRLFEGTCPEGSTPVPTRVGDHDVEAALVGFGPIAAAALTARALASAVSEPVCLAGVAGTYDARRLPVGGLLVATEAVCADVGRGRGDTLLGPEALGLAQVPAGPTGPAIHDRLRLAEPPAGILGQAVRGGLLTVSRASGSAREADVLRRAHPDVLGEEMEAFAVALAAACAGRHVHVLRGICNVAGDADRARWRVDEALAAVREGLLALLGTQGPS